MVKLKAPLKQTKKIERLIVPDFELVLQDKNATMWLHFPDLPFSKLDTVLAEPVDAYNFDGSDLIVGVAYPLYFKYTKKNLFPLVVQSAGDVIKVRLKYYCYKLNKIFVTESIVLYAGETLPVGTPTEPFGIMKEEMNALSGV